MYKSISKRMKNIIRPIEKQKQVNKYIVMFLIHFQINYCIYF